jgi:divalent metal cation (Fe/Co/Zn/Cd) transporter
VVRSVLLADAGIMLLRVPIALATGSLTLVSEVVRSAFNMGASIFAYRLMLALHRGRLHRFAYGTHKIEQFAKLLVGLGLVISGLWIASNVLDTLFSPGPVASPFGLAAAAVFNAVNTLINTIGWLAMKFSAQEHETEVYRTQTRARFTLMVSSLLLQATLTAAALARDGGIALILDAAGATFVAGLMILNGLKMLAAALPVLLDAPAPGHVRALIRSIVARLAPDEELVRLRTRRAGAASIAEVTVRGSGWTSIAALQSCSAAIENALSFQGEAVDVAVVLAAEDDAADGAEQTPDPVAGAARDESEWT